MSFAIGKAHHLVLEGRAIAGADPPDCPGIQRGEADVFADDPVGLCRRRRKEGWEALCAQFFRGERERDGIGIAVLTDKAGEVDRGGAQAGWGSRLHPPHLESERSERSGEFQRGDFPCTACRVMDVADVNESPEKGSGGQHDRLAAMKNTRLIDNAANPTLLDDEAFHQPLAQVESLLPFHHAFHGETVKLFVALEARGLDGRPLGGVQQPEVHGGFVRDPAHLAAQRVDLLDELAFGEAADCGIAGHQSDRVEADVEQKGLASHPGGRQGRLAARVPSPDHNDVIHATHGFPTFPDFLAVRCAI